MSVGLFALPDVSWQGEAACLSSVRTSDSHGGGLSQLPLLRSLKVSPSSLHARPTATIPPIERRRAEWTRREDEAADASHLKSGDACNIHYLYSIFALIPQQHTYRCLSSGQTIHVLSTDYLCMSRPQLAELSTAPPSQQIKCNPHMQKQTDEPDSTCM